LEDQTELTKEEDCVRVLTPGHVLMFATETPSPLAVGYDPKQSTKFVHDESKFIPSAHTCGNMLYLYVNEKTVTGPFHHYLLTAMMNGGVFSKL
jgi:hypothetical protein